MPNSIKVLIGDNSPAHGTAWAALFKQAGFYAITRACDFSAILQCASDKQPEVIVLVGNAESRQIIRAIRGIPQYSPYIAVVGSDSFSASESEFAQAGADCFLPCHVSTTELITKVLSLIISNTKLYTKPTQNLSGIECEVTDIIRGIGIPAHIKGYHYIRTAIILSVKTPEIMDNVTKILYPSVAHQHHTTASRVERAIRHAIGISWERGDEETFNSYLGYAPHTLCEKPTNSEFIAVIADRLRVERS